MSLPPRSQPRPVLLERINQRQHEHSESSQQLLPHNNNILAALQNKNPANNHHRLSILKNYAHGYSRTEQSPDTYEPTSLPSIDKGNQNNNCCFKMFIEAKQRQQQEQARALYQQRKRRLGRMPLLKKLREDMMPDKNKEEQLQQGYWRVSKKEIRQERWSTIDSYTRLSKQRLR